MVESSAGYFVVRVPAAAPGAATAATASKTETASLKPVGPNAAADDGILKPYGEDGFDFYDLLDVINPLQHIPIVSTLYRAITGDEIASIPRVVGGTLFGGPIGGGAALINAMLDETSGRDIGEHVLALFRDEETPSATTVAEAASSQSTALNGRLAADTLAALLRDADLAGPFSTEPAAVDPAAPQVSAVPSDGGADNWFGTAVLAGLDRYGESGTAVP